MCHTRTEYVLVGSCTIVRESCLAGEGLRHGGEQIVSKELSGGNLRVVFPGNGCTDPANSRSPP